MKLWLAGDFNPDANPGLEAVPGARFLVSYHYVSRDGSQGQRTVGWAARHDIPLFLDSGAYSALTLGAEISLDDYVEYCREHGARYEHIAALDVIGDWRATARNHEAMRQAGIDAIPTFHVRAPFEELARLVRENGYVALGVAGMQSRHRKVMAWLARAFRVVRDTDPTTRIHGFALTGQAVIRSFPWYSVDSTSWFVGRRYGTVLMREGRDLVKVQRRDVRQGNRHAERALGLLPDPRQRTLAYAKLNVHNARTMIEWVEELNRWREEGPDVPDR